MAYFNVKYIHINAENKPPIYFGTQQNKKNQKSGIGEQIKTPTLIGRFSKWGKR